MIRVDVTEADIRTGVKGDMCNCPIAIAIKRAIGCSGVHVDGMWIEVHEPFESWRQYRTPDVVDAFIDRFDAGQPVAPFSFVLHTGA